MAAIATIPGSFSDAAWTKNAGGGTSFSNSRDATRLDWTVASTASYTVTAAGWDLTGSNFSFMFSEVPAQGQFSVEWRDANGTTAYYRIILSSSAHTWAFQKTGSAVGSTWTDAYMRAHPYVRIREASGTTYLELSADGSSWAEPDGTQHTANIATITNIYTRFQANTTAPNGAIGSAQQVNGTAAPTSSTILDQITNSVVSAGTWTSATNTQANDATYATNTGTTQNTEYPMDLGFDMSPIPAGATINSVTVWMVGKISSTSRGQYRIDVYDGATLITGGSLSSFSDTTDGIYTLAATPTATQLRSGTFFVRITNKRTASQACTTSVTSVFVVVDYVAATTWNADATGTETVTSTGAAGGVAMSGAGTASNLTVTTSGPTAGVAKSVAATASSITVSATADAGSPLSVAATDSVITLGATATATVSHPAAATASTLTVTSGSAAGGVATSGAATASSITVSSTATATATAANAKIETLDSVFNNASEWNPDAAVTVTSTTATITPTSLLPRVTAVAGYDLTGSSIYFKIDQLHTQSSSGVLTSIDLKASASSANEVRFLITSATTTVYMRYIVASASTQVGSYTWSASRPWLRIRESGGTIYWDDSADGSSWTNQATWVHGGAIDLTNLEVGFLCNDPLNGSSGSTIISHVNTPGANNWTDDGTSTITVSSTADATVSHPVDATASSLTVTSTGPTARADHTGQATGTETVSATATSGVATSGAATASSITVSSTSTDQAAFAGTATGTETVTATATSGVATSRAATASSITVSGTADCRVDHTGQVTATETVTSSGTSGASQSAAATASTLTATSTATASVTRVAAATASTLTVSATATTTESEVSTAGGAVTVAATASGNVAHPVAATDSSITVTSGGATAGRGQNIDGSSTVTVSGTAASGSSQSVAATASSITVSGTTTDTAAFTGAASSTITATATADASVSHPTTGSSTVTVTATSTDSAAFAGSSSSTVTVTVTADAIAIPLGTVGGSSTLTVSGTADASVAHPVAATDSALTVSGSATSTADHPVTGSSTVTVTVTSDATTSALTQADGSSTVTVTASSTARSDHPVDGSSTVTVTGTSESLVTSTGEATGTSTIVVAVTAAATVTRHPGADPSVLTVAQSATAAGLRPATAVEHVVLVAEAIVAAEYLDIAAATVTFETDATAFVIRGAPPLNPHGWDGTVLVADDLNVTPVPRLRDTASTATSGGTVTMRGVTATVQVGS